MKIVFGIVLSLVVGGMPGGGMLGSEFISVRYGPGEQDLARSVLSSTTKAKAIVEERLGIATTKEVLVLLAPGGKRGFESAQPGETPVPEWAVGTAYPRSSTMVLRRPDNYKFRFEELDATIAHEYAHLAVGTYFGDARVPRWLDEGLASFAAGERSLTASATIGIAAITGNVIPFENLADWWPPGANQADLAYAQSVDFVRWIESSRGPGTIKSLVKAFKEMGDLDAALTNVAGKNLAALEAEWLGRVEKRYVWIPVLSGGFSLWGIASILFLMGYWRKRKMGAIKIKQWEIEEESRRLNNAPPPPTPLHPPRRKSNDNNPTLH